ncbi:MULTISPECIES: hypothetical protein [Pandoraea]|uniref:hypothetical protein n=1 Tax=Pandoraea TaxID=93217 RepID=UPI001F5CF7AB|nr:MULTISPECIES: hypothetical protein [Pandoraea]MCI3208280.1 hypothetical protein [Pandoraea sp. LA3]MDN4586309.1 hypothetical protein [Pandoraea capi]
MAIVPVKPVPPVAALAAQSAVSAVGPGAMPVAPSGTGPAASMPPPASAEMEARFRQSMANAALERPGNVGGAHTSVAAQMVASQDDAVNRVSADVAHFQAEAGEMDTRELTANMVRLQFEMAETMARIELGVGFAQGGKGAVQNLMKNQ